VYQAGTLSGNPLGMAAGLATLRLCRAEGFYESLASKTRRLAEGLAAAGGEAGIAVQTGYCGGMFGMALRDRAVRNFDDARACDHERYARFFHAMLDRGVWLPPSGYEAMFISAAHDDAAITRVLEAARESFERSDP
jgi:glutamate-1-semialdehyde 2,1-aminomutase